MADAEDVDVKDAPTAAIGYTHAPTFTWWLDENETTPELQFPQSVRVFDSMRRTDSQVTSVLQAVCLPVERTPWRIDPNGARDEVVQFVADDFGLPIAGQTEVRTPLRTKNRFSWTEHLRLALLMLPYGFSYFEQLYRVDDDGSRAHLAKLEFRPHTTIDKVEVATDGGLVYVQQCWTAQNSSPRPIPVDRLVAYVHRREGGNWLGQSILRPVYKNWLLKDRLLRVQAQTIERNGMGIPVYEGAENEQSLSTGLAMATGLRSGEAAGAATPFGAKLRLMGVEGTLPDAKPAVEYHDTQIARAVLAHFLNLGTQTGSWALGSTFADFFTLSLQTLAQQIASTTTQHVIEDLVDVNWGPDEPAPRLCFDEIGSRQAATAEALKSLVDAGILHPDEPLEGATRQFYGLPPADPSTATPPPGGAPTATPDAPTQTGEYSVAASRRRVRAKFDPSQPRDPHTGKWSDGGVSALIKSLKKVGGVGAWSMRGDDDAYMDWSTRNSDGTFGLEATGDNGETVGVGLTVGQVGELHQELTRSIAKRFEGPLSGGYIPTDDVDGPYFEWTGLEFDEAGRYADGQLEIGDGENVATFDMSERDLTDWHQALTIWLLTQVGGDEVKAARLLASLDRVAASAGVDLDDEASWIAAAAGVDTHPGGERLKRWWVYGGGAARWTTWTQLYDELKEHIKNVKKLKATVSAWYRLRYGHNPPRHHVAASALSGSNEALAAYAEEFGEPDDGDDWDFQLDALLTALDELSTPVIAAFDAAKHPRNPAGGPGGGRFRSTVDRLKDALTEHRKPGGKGGDPFEGFDREQLRRAAVKQGISLDRGESRDSIAKKLTDHIGPAKSNPRAQKLADRQSKAGQAAAGGGRTPRAEAAADRRRQKEILAELALVQMDIDRDDELGGVMERRKRDRLEDEKDALRQEYDEIEARYAAKPKKATPKKKAAPKEPAADPVAETSETGGPADTPAWPAFSWPESDGNGPTPMPVLPQRQTVEVPAKPPRAGKAKRVTKADFAARADAAASGRDVLASAPIDVPVHETFAVPGAPDSWSQDRVRRAAQGVAFYRASDYIDINDALRSGTPVSVGTAENIEGIDDVMSLSALPHDVVVHRGISNPSVVFGDAWKPKGSNAGLTWTDGAYSSTTADERVARHFAGDDRLMMRILVPKGTPAVKLSDMSAYPKPGSGDEAELLLDRGLTFRIVADRGVDPDTGIRMIDVAVS